jgi:cytochrome c556
MRLKIWIAALGVVAIGGTAMAQGDVIAQRRAGLKRMGEHMEAMKPIVDAAGDVKPLVPKLDDMIAWYKGMPKLFPPGSDKGDTKAKPEIWQNFADFEALDAKLVTHLESLRTLAAAGDVAAFDTAWKATGGQFCGACHRPYRNR